MKETIREKQTDIIEVDNRHQSVAQGDHILMFSISILSLCATYLIAGLL